MNKKINSLTLHTYHIELCVLSNLITEMSNMLLEWVTLPEQVFSLTDESIEIYFYLSPNVEYHNLGLRI